jgi:hypothetical protein
MPAIASTSGRLHKETLGDYIVRVSVCLLLLVRLVSTSGRVSLCLLLLVRLGDYIVNLCVFYFYKLIGKLTAFVQLQQEFSLRNPTSSSSYALLVA